MAKNVAVLIQEDPRKTHRPVEALRIALGLAAGSHTVTVILVGEALRLLSEDVDDIVDVDILEKFLPTIEQLEIPFLVPEGSDVSSLRAGFRIHHKSQQAIADVLQSMDSTLIF